MALWIRPVNDTTDQWRARYLGQLGTDLIAILRASVGPGAPINLREADATDFSNDVTTGALGLPTLTADTWNDDCYSTFTLSDQQCLGIAGLVYTSGVPVIDEGAYKVLDQTFGTFEFSRAWANTRMPEAWIYPAWVWPPKAHVQIELLSHLGSAGNPGFIQWIALMAEANSQYASNPKTLAPGNRIPGWIG